MNASRKGEGLSFRDWFRRSQELYHGAGISLWDFCLWYRAAWLPPDSEEGFSLEALSMYWDRQYENDLSPEEAFRNFLMALCEDSDFDFGPPYPRLIEANYQLAIANLREFWEALLDFEYAIKPGSDLDHSVSSWFIHFQGRFRDFIEAEKAGLETMARTRPGDIRITLKRPRRQL